MGKEVTLQTIDKDLTRELRINNFIGLMNQNQLIKANQNIVGSTMFLSKQVGTLSNTFCNALSGQTAILNNTLSRIGFALSSIDSNIVAIGELLKQQNSILTTTLEKLDEIYNTLKHPLEVESKEQFERGIQWMEKGFLTEAAEAFQISIEKNPTNYLSHFYLGVLYLCGKDEDDDVVDFEKSETELKLAIKYSKPDVDNNLVKQYIIAIHQHLSDLYYAKALLGENEKDNYELAYKELQKALKIDDSEATVTCLASRLIRCANRLEKPDDVIKYAGKGFLNDSSLLSLLCDDELSQYHEQFIEIIDECRMVIRERINNLLIEETGDAKLLLKSIESSDGSDCSTYLALSTILSDLTPDAPDPKAIETITREPARAYSVSVYDWEAQKIALIKFVMENTSCRGLAEAKKTVETKNPLFNHLTKKEAENLEEKLELAGFYCEIEEDF